MASTKILRAGIFILAFIIGLLRDSIAKGKESWQIVHEVEGIREYRLQNGLQILFFPDQSQATVTVNITYFVGSRHEGYGEAGMAHLLEHMLFRGTRERPNIMQLLEEKSGQFNGMTWPDGTLYYETLPASRENLEFALALEADRMLNSRIAPEDLAKEFSVVRNEFEMDENNPRGVLSEHMLSAAYQWHGYGRSTIGNKSDIENMPVERLQAFYRRFYQPDNAMLVVAGQFDEKLAKQLIETYFSRMEKPKRQLKPTYTIEPVQEGEKQITIRRSGDEALVGLIYHTVAGGHPEAPAVRALTAMLSEQPRGILYKELVEKGLASEVEGSMWTSTEPGVVNFLAKAAQGQNPEKLAQRMIEIVEAIKPEQLLASELARFQRHSDRDFTLSWNSNETVVGISEWAALGDWRLLFVNRDAIQNLTLKEVQESRRYFQPSNRTLGYFIPTDQAQRVAAAKPVPVAERLQRYQFARSHEPGELFEASWPHILQKLQTFQLSNGLRVAILPKQSRGKPVSMVFNVALRHDASLKNQTTSLHLLAAMMMRGTKKMGSVAFDDALARHKAYIEGHSEWNLEDPGLLRLSAITVGEHSSAALDLLLDAFQTPQLADDEWQLLQMEMLAALKEEQHDPGSLASREFLRSMAPYEEGDPRFIPSLTQEISQIESMSLDLVKKTHRNLLQYGSAQLVIIGAVNPEQIKAQLERRLSDWKPQPQAVSKRYAMFESQGISRILSTPDKKGAQILVGLPLALSDEDPDYPALKMGAMVWGETMGSRLVRRLRHDDGLSYGAGGGFNPGIQSPFGQFTSFALCAPHNVTRAIQGLREELYRLLQQGISPQELSEVRNAYGAQRKSSLADDGNLLELILKNLLVDRSLDYEAGLDRKLEEVQANDIQAALRKWLKPEELIIIQALDPSASDQAT